jgi:hypothetical protein
VKTFGSAFAWMGDVMREKEKKTKVNQYLDLLVYYDAKLVKSGARDEWGSRRVVAEKTGAELPLTPKGRLLMVNLLLDECGSVEAVNERVQRYRASHS